MHRKEELLFCKSKAERSILTSSDTFSKQHDVGHNPQGQGRN